MGTTTNQNKETTQVHFGKTVSVGATYKDIGEGLLAGAGMIQEQLSPQTLTLAHKRWSYCGHCTIFRYFNRSESLFPAAQLG